MAVTLKDEAGTRGAPGSVVTIDARTDRFGAFARSGDAELEDFVQAVIDDLEGPFGWATVIPRAEVFVAQALVARFGLAIVADTTPDPDRDRPSAADDRVIY